MFLSEECWRRSGRGRDDDLFWNMLCLEDFVERLCWSLDMLC